MYGRVEVDMVELRLVHCTARNASLADRGFFSILPYSPRQLTLGWAFYYKAHPVRDKTASLDKQ